MHIYFFPCNKNMIILCVEAEKKRNRKKAVHIIGVSGFETGIFKTVRQVPCDNRYFDSFIYGVNTAFGK